MINKNVTFIFGLFFFIQSFAVVATAEEVDLLNGSTPHHRGTVTGFNLGLRYSSLMQYRGIVLYKDFQIDPVISLFFLDDKAFFTGDSVGYADFLYQDKIRFRTRLVVFADSPLFPYNDAIRSQYHHREGTYEWSNRFEYYVPGYNKNYVSNISIDFRKDLSQHNGNYFEVEWQIKLFDYELTRPNYYLEPHFFVSSGWGDQRHNKYLYGPSADRAEFTNINYGIVVAFPKETDRFYPILLLKHFEAIGKSKNAEYAHGNQGWLFSFIASYNILNFF